jgi:tRNA dimethylallyltransferase
MPQLVAVMGPTASGKSDLAESLATLLDAQLINADAFQVYQGMDIGTGKSTHKGRYLLLDLVNPTEQFGLGRWVQMAHEALVSLYKQGKSAVLVGGTGLYVRALMEEYDRMSDKPDEAVRNQILLKEAELGSAGLFAELEQVHPETASTVAASNPLRVRRAWERVLTQSEIPLRLPPFQKIKIGLEPPSEVNRDRIALRVQKMMDEGWLAEVNNLLESGVTADSPGFKAIGYRNLAEHIAGNLTLAEAQEQITIATRQYAKRQRTWLRSEPGLKYLPWDEDVAENIAQAERLLIHNGTGDA